MSAQRLRPRFELIAKDIDVRPAMIELDTRGAPRSMPLSHFGPNPDGLRIINLLEWDDWHGRLGERRYEALDALLVKALEIIGLEPFRARVRIIPPYSKIEPHRDNLKPSLSRHHLVLLNSAVMTIGGTSKVCAPGELWRVDLRNRLHSVDNSTRSYRIILLIDCWNPGMPREGVEFDTARAANGRF